VSSSIHNEGGSANDDANDQFTTFLFSGDNSAFTGRLTIGPEAGNRHRQLRPRRQRNLPRGIFDRVE
jgi:hypothetical protein